MVFRKFIPLSVNYNITKGFPRIKTELDDIINFFDSSSHPFIVEKNFLVYSSQGFITFFNLGNRVKEEI